MQYYFEDQTVKQKFVHLKRKLNKVCLVAEFGSTVKEELLFYNLKHNISGQHFRGFNLGDTLEVVILIGLSPNLVHM